MDWDWKALGAALRERREVLRLTRAELGRRTNVHASTIKRYESGETEYDKIPKTVMLLQMELGWTPPSAQAVLEGGKPTLQQHAYAGTETDSQGRTVELRVSDLRGAVRDGMLRMLPDATASQILAAEDEIIGVLRREGRLPPEPDGE